MKKIYHLTIEYDDATDEVEYLVETVDVANEDNKGDDWEPEIEMVEVMGIDVSKYFDQAVLRLIAECYEVGEA